MNDYQFSLEVAEVTNLLSNTRWMVSARRAVMDHNFTWSDDTADKFATRIDALCTPLLESQRNMGPIVFTFANSKLLIVSHGVIRICFFTSGSINQLDELALRGHALIQKHEELIFFHSKVEKFSEEERLQLPAETAKREAEAREREEREKREREEREKREREEREEEELRKITEAWKNFESFLMQVLGKIIPLSQATMLIDVAKAQIAGDAIPQPAQYLLLAQSILKQVPHKTKRQALEHEIDEYLNA